MRNIVQRVTLFFLEARQNIHGWYKKIMLPSKERLRNRLIEPCRGDIATSCSFLELTRVALKLQTNSCRSYTHISFSMAQHRTVFRKVDEVEEKEAAAFFGRPHKARKQNRPLMRNSASWTPSKLWYPTSRFCTTRRDNVGLVGIASTGSNDAD